MCLYKMSIEEITDYINNLYMHKDSNIINIPEKIQIMEGYKIYCSSNYALMNDFQSRSALLGLHRNLQIWIDFLSLL
jgi:hypothetical protein